MSTTAQKGRWWVAPLLFAVACITALAITWQVSETAREVLSKAVLMVAGALATPFILETTVAALGLVIVLVINQIRLQREGDGWVYLAQTEPDAASVATGAEAPPKRLEAVVVPAALDGQISLDARIAMAEGYLDLGLKQEALEHLNLLSPDEQQDSRVQRLRSRLAS